MHTSSNVFRLRLKLLPVPTQSSRQPTRKQYMYDQGASILQFVFGLTSAFPMFFGDPKRVPKHSHAKKTAPCLAVISVITWWLSHEHRNKTKLLLNFQLARELENYERLSHMPFPLQPSLSISCALFLNAVLRTALGLHPRLLFCALVLNLVRWTPALGRPQHQPLLGDFIQVFQSGMSNGLLPCSSFFCRILL